MRNTKTCKTDISSVGVQCTAFPSENRKVLFEYTSYEDAENKTALDTIDICVRLAKNSRVITHPKLQ